MVIFGLTLFLHALKKHKFDSSQQKTREMLDPFVHLFRRCLKTSKSSEVWILVLKVRECVCRIVKT